MVANVPIFTQADDLTEVDTITLYVGPAHQQYWLPTILALHPRRVIFNPGTENPEIEQVLHSRGIIVEHACTLVLLSTNQF